MCNRDARRVVRDEAEIFFRVVCVGSEEKMRCGDVEAYENQPQKSAIEFSVVSFAPLACVPTRKLKKAV